MVPIPVSEKKLVTSENVIRIFQLALTFPLLNTIKEKNHNTCMVRFSFMKFVIVFVYNIQERVQ